MYDSPFGIQKNEGKMQGVALYQHQGQVVKALFAKCGIKLIWMAMPNELLDDYVEDGEDNVVGFQQQSSWDT